MKIIVAEEQPLENQRILKGWETLYKWLVHTELRPTGALLTYRAALTPDTPPRLLGIRLKSASSPMLSWTLAICRRKG